MVLGAQSTGSTLQKASIFASLSFLLFQEALKHGEPSPQRVRAATEWALRDVSRAPQIWRILHHALQIESQQVVRDVADEEDPKQFQRTLGRIQFLWYVIDALMKHVPHVYVLLLSPFLLEAVEHYLPWSSWLAARNRLSPSLKNNHPNTMNNTGVGGGGVPRWCIEMIRSWSGWLPLPLYQEVSQRLTEFRMKNEYFLEEEEEEDDENGIQASEKESNSASLASLPKNGKTQAGKEEEQEERQHGQRKGERRKGRKMEEQATAEECQKLHEDWEALYYAVQSVVVEGERMDMMTSSVLSPLHWMDERNVTSAREIASTSSRTSDRTSEKRSQGEQNERSENTHKALSSRQETGVHHPSLLPFRTSRPTTAPPRPSHPEEQEEEEDYIPDFVSGAQPRQMPIVDIPRLRTRRDARRRQREDDF